MINHLYPRNKFILERDIEGVGLELCSTLVNLKGSARSYLFSFFKGFTYYFPFPSSL